MESSSRTLVCSVLFLDIVEYSKKAVADQLSLKQAFNQVLATALEQVAQRDRIILDTGDGAAVTFMGDPEDALFAAMAVRDVTATSPHGAALPIRLGINLGPVRLVKDLNGQMNIIGDGINVAQRVMSFSRPGQLLVSRSFYEVVSCLSRDYLNLFRHEGSRTDKHVREHEVYSVGGAPAAKRVAQTVSQAANGGVRGWLAGTGPFGMRRTALIAAPAMFFLAAGAALALNAMLEPAKVDRPLASPVPPPAKSVARAEPFAPGRLPAAVPYAEKPPPVKKTIEKKAQRTDPVPTKIAAVAATRAKGRVVLAISPWGEVLVDGLSRGMSPPLQSVEVPPGRHRIEIRNGEYPNYHLAIEVKPGQASTVTHSFR